MLILQIELLDRFGMPFMLLPFLRELTDTLNGLLKNYGEFEFTEEPSNRLQIQAHG